MKLSKFFHKQQISKNLYAIFNSLIMSVLFVSKKELDLIENYKYFDNNVLLENGIYVLSKNEDEKALKAVKNAYLANVGKVKILYLCVTDSCNFNCKYCFVNKSSDNLDKYNFTMTFDIAKKAIDKWLEHTNVHNIKDKTILFYGGEPLLNFKLIKKVVNYISSLKEEVQYEIVTNGSLITDEISKFFNDNSFSVGISIDGPKEINDKNRIFNNSNLSTYDKVISGLNILNNSKNNFGLSITLSYAVLDNEDTILDWLKVIKPHGIYYNLLHITDSNLDWKKYSERANQFLIKSNNELRDIPIIEGCIDRKIDSYYNEKFKFANCGAIGLNQISIKATGEVCICQGCSKISRYNLGHIDNFDFEDIKNRKNKIWINKAPIMNDTCLSCPALFLCGGGCAMEAESIFEDSNHLDLPFCIHSKKMLEWLLEDSYLKMENRNEKI